MHPRRIPRTTSLRAAPTRQWAARLTLLFIVTFGATVMVLSRTNSSFVTTLRATATDVLVPVISVVTKPVDAVRDFRVWMTDMASLQAQNASLQAQVHSLAQWQTVANEIQAENDALRKLIQVVPTGKVSYTAVRIVSESAGPYMRTALINGGKDDNISTGQAVIGPEGLAGRVVETGRSSARVLLLTDINSRVPVVGEISREHSIASGNNSRDVTLDYVESGSKMQAGERLLTSGDGGIFPPGIPVGVITSINGNIVTVRPLTDWSRMEYVSVVSYEF
jgi:rod shape-determining protein MreC